MLFRSMVTVDGERIDLSYKEFELLAYFMENAGIALSREKILNSVWNYDYFGDARTIDMQIQKIIEQKLKDFDDKIGSKVTNILVMNPQNGEILGMTSSYPYNLNKPMDEKSLLSLYSQSEIDKMKAYTKQKQDRKSVV